MEILLFSDIHIYCHKKRELGTKRLEDCLKVLNWVFDIAEQRNTDTIIFGGDLNHDRSKIEVYSYQRMFETLENRLKSNKFKLYLLLGNHDLWYNDKTTINSIVPLSSLPGVKLISEPERLNINGNNWDFIPFTLNPIESLEELKKKSGNPEYCIGHIAVDGAILHGSHGSDVTVEHDGEMTIIGPNLFNHYKHTFLGHYHTQQMITEKVEYIGSPLELNFSEAFKDKHIIVFDGKTNKKTYIKNDFSPKHLVINIEDKEKYDLEGNFVKIKTNNMSSIDLSNLKKEIAEKASTVEIAINRIKIEEQVITDAKSILNDQNMCEKFVDQVGTKSLDKEKLLKVVEKIKTYAKS